MFKLITLLLSSLLIVQVSLAAPISDPSDLQQLIVSAGETYEEFFGYATEKYRELFETVLKNSESDAATDEELKTALMPFAIYVGKMHNNPEKNRETLQMLFDESTQLADKYDRGVPIDSSDVDHKIAKYMNDANAMKTKFDILMQYITSLQAFANNVRKYLETVPEAERPEQRKLKQWYLNWQRQHEWEKKNDLMMNFFEIFDQTKDDRSRLNEKVIKNILIYLNAVVMERKDLYQRVIKTLEKEITDPNDSTKFQLDMMREIVDRAEKVRDLNGREVTFELLRIFGMIQEMTRRYKTADLPENEREIAKILEKNGEINIEVREMLLTLDLGAELTKDVEEYFEIISKEQLESESKLKEWFEDVMDEKDYDVKAGKLVSLIENLRKSIQ